MKPLLASTFLMAALTAGAAFAAPEGPPPGSPPPPPHARMHEAISQLPEDKQKLVKEVMEAGRKEHQDVDAKVKPLADSVRANLAGANFDKGKFVKDMGEIEDLRAGVHKHQMERLADVLAKLTPEERKMMGDTLPLQGPPPPPPHGGPVPHDAPPPPPKEGPEGK